MALEPGKLTGKDADEIVQKYFDLGRKYEAAKVRHAYTVIAYHEFVEKNSYSMSAADIGKYHMEEFESGCDLREVEKEYIEICDLMDHLGIAI
jgi:hypothetical protein